MTACPFDILADPTPGNELYRALGMTLRTLDAGSSKDRGEYLQHSSFVKSLASSIAVSPRLARLDGRSLTRRQQHSLRLVKGNPGDMKLLGGEVIFAPTRRTDVFPARGRSRTRLGGSQSSDEVEQGVEEVEVVGIHRMKWVAGCRPNEEAYLLDRTTRDHGSVTTLLGAVGVDLRTSASCLDEA